MRITCPTCGTRYAVEPDRIGIAGRMVECTACSMRWLVRPRGSVAVRGRSGQPPGAAGRARRQPSLQTGRDFVWEKPRAAPAGTGAPGGAGLRERQGAAAGRVAPWTTLPASGAEPPARRSRRGLALAFVPLGLLLLAGLYLAGDRIAAAAPGTAPHIAGFVDAVDAAAFRVADVVGPLVEAARGALTGG